MGENISFFICFHQLPLRKRQASQTFQGGCFTGPKALAPRCQRLKRKETVVWSASVSLACTQRKLTCRLTKDLKDDLTAFRLESLPTTFQFGGLALLIEQRPARPAEKQVGTVHTTIPKPVMRMLLCLFVRKDEPVSRSHPQFVICSHCLLQHPQGSLSFSFLLEKPNSAN